MSRSSRHSSIAPVHPAEIILDGLSATGISKAKLARGLGISRNTLYNLLNQKQGVTPEMALRLQAVWGSTAHTWLNLQIAHDLWNAQKKVDTGKLKRIAAREPTAA